MFLKLTRYDDTIILVNMKHISEISKLIKGCHLVYETGEQLSVYETFEELEKSLCSLFQ